ncbi:MAG: hydroxymethylbilane synthase [Pseudomonadales bacterium]|nr:hydroxymethylbilane synthase [Pseudomonadales bacterium]
MITIATRESALAMWQANHVKSALEYAHPGLDVRITGMTTEGDRNKSSPLSRIGGKGVFVKELEVALMEGRADIAVHSMKDVPAELPKGLILGAICEREDPRDAFVSKRYASLDELPDGARVGTSSLRRRVQVRLRYPGLDYPELRGNVDTRLRKLDDGEYDAIILATAGLLRLGLADRITGRLSPDMCLPAAGQGAVGIECREGDKRVMELIEAIDHSATSLCVRMERSVSQALGANCTLPIAAHAILDGEAISLSAFVSDIAGENRISVHERGAAIDGEAIARRVGAALLAQGAADLIEGA